MNKIAFIFLMYCIGLFLGVIVSAASHGQEIKINLVAAQGENSMSKDEILGLFYSARDYIKANTGVTLKLKRFVETWNPADKIFFDYYEAVNVLGKLHVWKSKRFKNERTFFVTNPFRERVDGVTQYYMLGYTYVCGTTGYSTAQSWNDLGQGRRVHSLVAMIHELLHLIGAKHLESEDVNMMKPGTLFFLGNSTVLPRLDPVSVGEIKKCLSKRRIK